MPSRTAKFVSAIFASFLASSPLTTTSSSAAGAADDCLSSPKGETPAGRHWYYRIDRPSNRHCWYLKEEGGKLAQSAPSNSSPSNSSPAATPISPKPETAMQGSVADAHAELSAQLPVQQPNRLNALSPALLADTPVVTQSAEPQRSVVASRWPGSSGADPAINPAPVQDDPGTDANASPQTQPPPVLAASPYAAADLSSETPTYSLKMQLVALAAALALAGIVASIIFKLGSARRPAGRVRERRGAIWEPTDDDSIVLSAPPRAEARARRHGFARDLDRADDPNDRIAEFYSQLSQLSKQTPT